MLLWSDQAVAYRQTSLGRGDGLPVVLDHIPSIGMYLLVDCQRLFAFSSFCSSDNLGLAKHLLTPLYAIAYPFLVPTIPQGDHRLCQGRSAYRLQPGHSTEACNLPKSHQGEKKDTDILWARLSRSCLEALQSQQCCWYGNKDEARLNMRIHSLT